MTTRTAPDPLIATSPLIGAGLPAGLLASAVVALLSPGLVLAAAAAAGVGGIVRGVARPWRRFLAASAARHAGDAFIGS